jgi:hypothetical protein
MTVHNLTSLGRILEGLKGGTVKVLQIEAVLLARGDVHSNIDIHHSFVDEPVYPSVKVLERQHELPWSLQADVTLHHDTDNNEKATMRRGIGNPTRT